MTSESPFRINQLKNQSGARDYVAYFAPAAAQQAKELSEWSTTRRLRTLVER